MATGAQKENLAHVEDDAGATTNGAYASKPTVGQKFKRHCARFWWLHLIILIVVVLVVTLPVVYVAYPNKAQSTINKSKLEVTSQSLLNPAPDAYDLQLNSVFLSNSSLHAQLDAFQADLCLEGSDVPFAQLSVPAVKAANGSETHVSQRIQIHNTDEFNEYAKTSLLSKEYTIYLKGKGGLKYGGLHKTTVKYNEKITMQGLNGLAGFNVTDFQILTTAQPDGSNANGTVLIPNPTVATYAMGNLTMDMFVGEVFIGNSTLQNVVLRPGNNTFPLRSVTNQTAVVGLLFNEYKSGIFPINIVSRRAIYDGEDLPYYEQALQANNLTIHLNVIEVLVKSGLAGYLGINTTSTA